jgi:hypothetical protein
MYPQYDPPIVIAVDYATLYVPDADDIREGFGLDEYRYLTDVRWDDARCALDFESEWLERASQAPGAESFESVAVQAEEADHEAAYGYTYGVDVGVAGLAFCLSAARLVTVRSCRGHPGDGKNVRRSRRCR